LLHLCPSRMWLHHTPSSSPVGVPAEHAWRAQRVPLEAPGRRWTLAETEMRPSLSRPRSRRHAKIFPTGGLTPDRDVLISLVVQLTPGLKCTLSLLGPAGGVPLYPANPKFVVPLPWRKHNFFQPILFN
jgi:hypothetical protein